jgi:hypothetical protein
MQQTLNTDALLTRAQNRLYQVAGGSYDSGNVRAARVTTEQRIDFFRSPEFREWVAAENACGRQVFWLKDVDMTQGAGDIFTFFFQWRAENGKFTEEQLKVIDRFLLKRKSATQRFATRVARFFTAAFSLVGLTKPTDLAQGPFEVLRLFKSKEEGGEGIEMLEFWRLYWPTQFGLTAAEKKAQVEAFVPHYAKRVYPGVPEENRVLTEAGVNVVIVSNGDQELAIAASSQLGIDPRNVVGSHLMYDANGISTGVNHSYEVFDKEWTVKPQPGKPLSFHYWVHVNRGRWGWKRLLGNKIVIAGMDGDSAASDGGMMILLKDAAIGNFMVNTPGAPQRIEKFYKVADKYGWTPGQFFTLMQRDSLAGNMPS